MNKIMIVDDSETLRLHLREALEGAGYQVLEAGDGAEGLRLAQSHADLNLVITDYNMPLMDGLTMVSRMREIEAYSKLPVFMLTTEATADIKAAGKAVGIVAWIVKPLVPAKVLPVIAKILAR